MRRSQLEINICLFVYFVHQSTSRKRNAILQEKHNLKRIKQLCGISGQHRVVSLTCTCSQNVTHTENVVVFWGCRWFLVFWTPIAADTPMHWRDALYCACRCASGGSAGVEHSLLPSSSPRSRLHHLRQRRLASRTAAGLLSRQNSVRTSRALLAFPVLVWSLMTWHGDSVGNSVEENSNVFSVVRMRWLPSARACGQ